MARPTNLPSLDFSLIISRSTEPPRPLNPTNARTGFWGWVIYRTVYTAESKQHWDSMLRTLDKLLLADFEHFNYGEDPGATNVAPDKYRTSCLKMKRNIITQLRTLKSILGIGLPPSRTLIKVGITPQPGNISWSLMRRHSQRSKMRLFATGKLCEVRRKRIFCMELRLYQGSRILSITNSTMKTGEEHWLDDEEPEFEHVQPTPSWPGHFPVSI